MEKVILNKVVRTKNDKTMLIFSQKVSEKSNNTKGYNEYTMWFDDLEVFEKLNQEDFGKVIDATLGYSQPNYMGQCSLEIKDLIINGKQIKLK